MTNDRKIAIFADTPLHVMNSLNLVWHNVENTKGNCDFFIHKQFSGYNNLITSLENSNLFKNVYACNIPIKREEKKTEHAYLRTLELFFPNRFLKKWTGGLDLRNKYDVLLMPAPLRFTVALYDLNRKADVWFYEDGTANYYGNILEMYGPKSKHLLKVLFNKGHETINPSRMYVNNVELCYRPVKWEIMPLPSIANNNDEFIKLLRKWFSGQNGEPRRKQITYLSAPIEIKKEETILKSVLTPLLSFHNQVEVRPHPREEKREYYGLSVAHNDVLWELMCATNVDETSVLISDYSTAQFMPKLLFNKEPYLVFTYRMYKSIREGNILRKIDKMVNKFVQSYNHPEKIFVVSSCEEYIKALMKIVEMLEIRDKRI